MNPIPPVANAALEPASARLVNVSKKLEASFLAEMYKAAGVGEARQSFGGGAGEDQFSSFLVQEYADATVAAGGIGLAESIYRALAQLETAK